MQFSPPVLHRVEREHIVGIGDEEPDESLSG
jgi:hypothetical protein